MSTTEQQQVVSKYSAKWQERFAFFDANGGPNDSRFKPAFKALKLGKKILININFIAWFFGPIYLFVLGLWKKNLTLLGVMLLTYVIVGAVFAIMGKEFPAVIDRGLGIGFAIMYGRVTNYAYYLKEVKGEQGWNPF